MSPSCYFLTIFSSILLGIGVADEVCYGDLGCFNNDLQCHRLSFPPMAPDIMNVQFHLYTHVNPVNFTIIDRNVPESLTSTYFNPHLKTVVLIHGWTDTAGGWTNRVRDALLQRESVNIVAVDWTIGAGQLIYPRSCQNARVSGKEVALFLKFIHDITGASYSNMHLIGHSLGAHVAGYAGEAQPGIGRITGSDAAGPGYTVFDRRCRLDQTDADFVDAIHTDGEFLGAGMHRAYAHMDFYPNGGKDQPGCRTIFLDSGCSHARSLHLFIESILSDGCRFKAYPCRNFSEFQAGNCTECGQLGCPEMGYYADRYINRARGKFYLSTNADSPYCIS
ncbi:pancreatic triacylglycerol lipase-like [Anneissia japonica]|uniref:pancreatic triacylglycerol lipase-like n=1 Tax=Anneissia japonica TaxID=1529436 RepID=UPI0014256E6B|nr:pancreatic triacylglycerol lipase-like [Anneissia japonica]